MILVLLAVLVLYAAAMAVLYLAARDDARKARDWQRSARDAARGPLPLAGLPGSVWDWELDRELDRKYAVQFQQVDEENEAIRGWNG